MSLESSANKRIARNSLFLSLRMIVVLGITLYTTRVVLRILGVEDYGIYNVVCGFVSMFAFLNTSMSNAIQRFLNFELGRNDKEGTNLIFCTSIQIQIILSLIIVLLSESIGLWYLHTKMVIPEERMFAADCIFQFSIISFVLIIMQAPFTAAVIAHEKMDFYALISVLDALLKLSLLFIIPHLSGDSLIWYGMIMAIICLLNFFAYYIYCKKRFDEINFHFIFNKKRFKSMLNFSGWNLFGSFSNMMEGQGINLVLNYFFGPIVNAARGISYQINGGIQAFVSNIAMPIRPQIVQSYAQGNLKRMINLTFGISKMSSAIILLMAIPISLEINFILSLWLGDQVPEHASSFTIIIIFTSLINNLNAAVSNVVHATGIMRQYQLCGSIIRICSIPVAFFSFLFFKQPELALLIVFFFACATQFVSLLIVRKLVGLSIREYAYKVATPIFIVSVCSLAIVFPIHLIMDESLLRLVLTTIMSVCIISIFFIYYVFDKRERELTFQLLRKPINVFLRKNNTKQL